MTYTPTTIFGLRSHLLDCMSTWLNKDVYESSTLDIQTVILLEKELNSVVLWYFDNTVTYFLNLDDDFYLIDGKMCHLCNLLNYSLIQKHGSTFILNPYIFGVSSKYDYYTEILVSDFFTALGI